MCLQNFTKLFFLGVIFIAAVLQVSASPIPGSDDDRFVEREYQSQSQSPGAHELATWLIAQLRNSNSGQNAVQPGCRYPNLAKRNSEIINSLLRLPQIDNGKK